MQIRHTVYDIKHDADKFMSRAEGRERIPYRACDDSYLDPVGRLGQDATNCVCATYAILTDVVLGIGVLEKLPIRVFIDYLLDMLNELNL